MVRIRDVTFLGVPTVSGQLPVLRLLTCAPANF